MGYTIHVEKDASGNITETPYGSTSNEASMILMNDNTSVQAKVMSLVSQIATLQGQMANTLEAPVSAVQNQVLAFNGTDWDATYVIEADNCNEWNASTTYAAGNTCICDGKDWKSKIDSNIGNRPCDGSNWEQLTLSSLSDTKADSTTTLAGYGITDAYTKTETDGFISPITTKLSDSGDWLKSNNLLNPSTKFIDNSGYVNNGITFTYDSNKVITLNGTCSTTISGGLGVVYYNTFPIGEYTATLYNYNTKEQATDIVIGNGTTNSVGSFTFNYDGTNNAPLVIGGKGGTTYSSKKYVLQIEKGSTATSYQPYSESNVVLTEKVTEIYDDGFASRNLFDKSLIADASSTAKIIQIQYEPNTTYTMSTNETISTNGSLFVKGGYYTTDVFTSETDLVKSGTPRTITTDSNGYISIYYRTREHSDLTVYNWMLNKGSSALPYQTYSKSNVQLTNELALTVKGKCYDHSLTEAITVNANSYKDILIDTSGMNIIGISVKSVGGKSALSIPLISDNVLTIRNNSHDNVTLDAGKSIKFIVFYT